MYNSYIPQGAYEPVSGRDAPPERKRGLLDGLLGGLSGGLPKPEGILKTLHLDRFDRGDILLILVLVYLFLESDNEDWLIVLALILLMGLDQS